jgi:Tautomerase enzyme
MFASRSSETQCRLYRAIVAGLGGLGIPPDDVLIVIHEPPMENWGVDRGTPGGAQKS